MKNIKQSSAHFAIILVLVSSIFICACRQTRNVTVYTMAPAMKTAFAYKPGSYWVYKDSTSGEIDSAYVTDNITNYSPISTCNANEPLHEFLTIEINVVKTYNPGAVTPVYFNEEWTLSMHDSSLSLSLSNTNDSVESNQNSLTLAKYPFETGYYSLHTGCVFDGYDDSANVTAILPSFSVNPQAYSNTAISYHGNVMHGNNDIYDDLYYISADAGIVKVAFNHHPNSLYRVLELQRYKLVK